MTPITYLSEQPADFSKAIDGAETLEELRTVLADWRELAGDAEKIALAMTPKDFTEFRKGLKKERGGEFAGEKFAEKYSAVLLPEVMFKISMKAYDYKVPFGLMYIRLKEAGILPELPE